MSVFSVKSVAINKGWSQTGLSLRSPTSRNPNIKDYRTAAFAIAITKMAQSYYELGLAKPL